MSETLYDTQGACPARGAIWVSTSDTEHVLGGGRRDPEWRTVNIGVVFVDEGMVAADSSPQVPAPSASERRPRDQYSFLITKKEPRMVPANFDFCLANLNREASSSGTSIPSDSLNPTARFLGSSTVYSTLIDRPLS